MSRWPSSRSSRGRRPAGPRAATSTAIGSTSVFPPGGLLAGAGVAAVLGGVVLLPVVLPVFFLASAVLLDVALLGGTVGAADHEDGRGQERGDELFQVVLTSFVPGPLIHVHG